MNQDRIKIIIDKLSSKELHNEESIKFSILATFSSIPIFINCVPACIDDIKYMIKGGKVFNYEIDNNETIVETISKFKSNWDSILEANIITINNFSYLPDVIVPLKALLDEENKNLFTIIALDEDAFMITKDYEIFKNFTLKTKIDYFSYMDKITRIVNDQNGNKLYLPIEEAFSKEELRYEISKVSKVNIPNDVMIALKMIYSGLEKINEEQEEFDEEIILTKERWKEIISILKACAFLNGRDYINLTDLFLLKKILWTRKKQISLIGELIYNTVKYIVHQNCLNIEKISREMLELLIDMTRSFKLMKKEKNYSISNIDIIEWNSTFNRIKEFIIETKYYSRDFFDDSNNLFNIFIDNDDENKFLNLFKIDDKLIFDWFNKLKAIMKYVNDRQLWY